MNIKQIICFEIYTVKYPPVGAGSFIDLQVELQNTQALINIRNKDEKCFLWAVLAAIHPQQNQTNTL